MNLATLTHNYNLDMVPGGVPLVIHASQYDSDIQLVFNLYASTGTLALPNGWTASIRGTKPDGHGISIDSYSYSYSNKTVTINLTKQMTACAGRCIYEIVLEDGDDEICSANFILQVERAALDADTIRSDSVLRELQAIIDGAATATQAAEDAAASAEAAAESAASLEIDDTLTQTGQAADAKAVGDEIADLKADLSEIVPGLSDTAKEALLACFEHVAWIDSQGAELYNTLYEALYEEIEILTGDVIDLGNLVYGAKIVNFGSALGVYVEDTAKNVLTNDYTWELTTGYSFITEDNVMHIDGTYTGTSNNIGGYIYEGAFKSTQSSGQFDPLIKNDGKSYTVCFYARNLKEGQYLDVRCRTVGSGGSTYWHTINITQSHPYYKKTFTAEELATLGSNMGIGVYYYYNDDKNFEDVQVRITVSDADDATQYIYASSGSTNISPMDNCVAVADSTVSIRKRGAA